MINGLSIYPVGSIYLSTTNINPSKIFGGTWEQIKDRFLLACGDTYQAGTEGGEAEHTLTIDEMPEHTHKGKYNIFVNDGAELKGVTAGQSFSPSGFSRRNDVLQNTGGSKPHNNMPPYLSVYMWYRKA